MVFASPIFLFAFMPLAVLICGAAKISGRAGLRNALLLVFSLVFYAWGEPVYVLLMVGAIFVNWLLGMKAAQSRLAFVAAVVLDLGMLAAFKYLDMFISGVSWLTRTNLPLSGIALPIGISFYTFQIVSYIIDVRRGDVPPERNIVRFAAYVSMFPQLIAGPIVRYKDVAEDLSRARGDVLAAASGARRFCAGLAKKVLIANIAAGVADSAFSQAGALSASAAWLGVCAYALQIYFDFSGYSDMAIGLGGMLGFRFPENFDHPYVSVSVRDFWRRWHISLSTWFRDYLYIPLGGSRRGRARTYVNLIIVFALCGLWHGADWSFLLWGLWHGLFLCLERVPAVDRAIKWLPKPLGTIYALLVVLLGWVLFRADSLAGAGMYFADMFGAGGVSALDIIDAKGMLALAAGVVFCLPLPKIRQNALTEALSTLCALALLAACAVFLAGGTYNPFIYFRF